MKFEHMETVNAIVSGTYLPRMFRARQVFPRPALEVARIPEILRGELENGEVADRIKPGMSIAITAGSRMIANSVTILRGIVEFVRAQGASPFLIPAMGSHGGATAEGQKDMLATLGITEETVGCPIRSSMETVCIGKNDEGVDSYMDRYAYEADGIIVFNRIKPHSGFRGKYESGLIKMMAVGLGKQYGAEVLHSGGDETLAKNIYLFGKAILEHSKVLFAVGVLENAYDETAEIHVVKAENILEEELVYLAKAFTYMPRVLVDSCDAMIVACIGKNYCGGGMDSNITGRFYSPLFHSRMEAQRIGVLDISEESHGNANGIGVADVISKRAFDKLDAATTYPNALTTTCYRNASIPLVMMNDRLVMQTCVKGCYRIDREHPRVIYLKNTLELEYIWLSESYLDEIQGVEGLTVESKPEYIQFDQQGNILRMP